MSHALMQCGKSFLARAESGATYRDMRPAFEVGSLRLCAAVPISANELGLRVGPNYSRSGQADRPVPYSGLPERSRTWGLSQS